MKILRESMTRVVTSRFVIRVWRQEKLNARIVSRVCLLLDIRRIASGITDQVEIAKRILKLSNVNAVEVLDKQARGIILYADWP